MLACAASWDCCDTTRRQRAAQHTTQRRDHTVSSHKLDSQIDNLRVSNPISKYIRIMCQNIANPTSVSGNACM